MISLKNIEKNKIEKLFEMSGGYVLNFSNKGFSQFFRENVNIDIDDAKYLFMGSSKANRLRAFWELEPDELVGKTLIEMIELWNFINNDKTNSNKPLEEECEQIVFRLLKKPIIENDNEENFLKKEFHNTSLNMIQMDLGLLPIMETRLKEVYKCMQINASLSVVILCGSILEGLLLGLACQNPQKFNLANSSPKDKQGMVKKFPEWTLENFIVEERLGYGPRMTDFRDTGAIEEASDQILFLFRREYYDPMDKPGMGEIIIAKNRLGSTGSVNVAFQKEICRFANFISY